MSGEPIEATIHGRIGSGPVDAQTVDAFCEMVLCVKQAIDDGYFDDRRAPRTGAADEGEGPR